MLSGLLTLLVLGILGMVAVAVVMALVGIAVGVVGFLLFKVAPLLLVGWLVLKLVNRSRASRHQLTAADQRWLDG